MIVPLKNIRNIKVTQDGVKVTYVDNTTYSLCGNIEFDSEYVSKFDSPITDHCI